MSRDLFKRANPNDNIEANSKNEYIIIEVVFIKGGRVFSVEYEILEQCTDAFILPTLFAFY